MEREWMDMDSEMVAGSTGTQDKAPAQRNSKGRFLPGHKKVGGERGKSKFLWAARELAEKKKCHPLSIALDVIVNGTLQGKQVSVEERCRMLREVLSYVLPKLSATQVTGVDGGPLAMATLDVTKLMENAELAEAAQTIALALAGNRLPDNPALLDGPSAGVGPGWPTNGER